MNPGVLEELDRRRTLVLESAARAEQAIRVADVCLTTAANLERTLATYQAFLGGEAGDPSILPATD